MMFLMLKKCSKLTWWLTIKRLRGVIKIMCQRLKNILRTEEHHQACKWATSKPKAVVAAETMGRIINDIVGYEEEHNRPHVATSIDCYTKEFKVSKEKAAAKLYEMIEDTWKDINKECLRPTTVAIHNITLFLQVMRICHVTYNDKDGYTHPEKHLEHEINFILADPIPI